jgi:DNA gyrase subunit A
MGDNLFPQDGVEENIEVKGALTTLEDRIEPRILEEQMQTSYLNYAMSVIVSRALPDVRDGLKPVHRRIIYVIEKMGLTPGAKYKKCAQVVGEVLGKYHPHGDSSVYDALARLAQDFSMRYTLVDGQGNFGSVDGDSPAAMRYTECRMDKLTITMTADIEKDTVDFVDNYDGSQREPTVLPTRVPTLLINGSSGIAVGMATTIPPHNLGEVCRGVAHLMHNPEATIEELTAFIPGPDLPTGGILYGKAGILEGYKTGRGKATLRAKAELLESSIVISEIPYQVNKSNLLINIAKLIREKRLTGIRDIRDESNKDGIRIVIETKRDTSPEVILNLLYKNTELQTNLHFNLIALIKKGRQPKLLNLKEILLEFIEHRYDVVTRRTKFDLKKAEAELHILDGLKIALDFIDEVIKIIRGSEDKAEASIRLQSEFKLSELQAEAVLQMRLQTLTNLDKSKIEADREVRIKLIAELKNILENPAVMKKLIETELEDIIEKYDDKRRTQIVDHEINEYNKEDFIEDEEVLVQLTKSQYMKVLPIDTFRQQGRGGRGVAGFNPKDEDYVTSSLTCNSHDYVYAFTNLGRVFRTRVFDLPSGSRTGRGQALVNYFEFQTGETVTNILTLSKEQEENQEGSIIFVTKQGKVKLTKLADFKNIRRTGIIAMGLKDEDQVHAALLSQLASDKVIVSASNGKTVIFPREQLSPMGRTAMGVKGIKLKKGEYVISLQLSDREFSTDESTDEAIIPANSDKTYPSILVVTSNGYAKHTPLDAFRQTNRAAGGVKTMNITKKTGAPILVDILYGDEESLIITTKKGITIRMSPETISQLGRNTQGVRAIKLDKGDEVVSGSVM